MDIRLNIIIYFKLSIYVNQKLNINEYEYVHEK